MSTLSVILITRNEEANLERCLRSIAWVDEIIVVDSNSTDRTPEIARHFKAKLFNPEWKGFGPAKQYALDQATSDWVLSIDADEEVSFTLKNEIQQLLESGPEKDGYFIPRKTQFLGRWILHSGWYPDYVLRLFQRGKGRFTAALVHEKVEVDGATGRLHNPLMHYSYPSIEDYMRKMDQYSTLGAKEMYAAKRPFRSLHFIIKPFYAFIRKLILQRGWRDGWEGYLIACLTSMGSMLRLAKLRMMYIDAEKARQSGWK